MTTDQIHTIEQNDISSKVGRNKELMYSAVRVFISWLGNKLHEIHTIHVCVGHGNNGADGILIAEKLAIQGYKVIIYSNLESNSFSELFVNHLERIKNIKCLTLCSFNQFTPISSSSEIVIDALLGIGVNRALRGVYKKMVNQMNLSKAPIYSVDIPSGLYGEGVTDSPTIKANATCSFEFPKLSFFQKENQSSLGEWCFKSIDIDQLEIDKIKSNRRLIDNKLVNSTLKKRENFSHKGTYGHVGIIAGEYGMAGAAILCGRSCLRTGVGLITMHGCQDNRIILQAKLPESLFINITKYRYDDNVQYLIGPGIERDENFKNVLKDIIISSKSPVVIDAGALNYISRNKNFLNKISTNSILTPHPKEFSRLFGNTSNSHERLLRQVEKSKEHNVIIVLKDHFTTITTPDGMVYYNMTGNAGLATGGSGDVLTGIIGAFLAQGYSPIQAAYLGVYIHGRAADCYVNQYDMLSLTPSGVVENIQNVIKEFYDS